MGLPTVLKRLNSAEHRSSKSPKLTSGGEERTEDWPRGIWKRNAIETETVRDARSVNAAELKSVMSGCDQNNTKPKRRFLLRKESEDVLMLSRAHQGNASQM